MMIQPEAYSYIYTKTHVLTYPLNRKKVRSEPRWQVINITEKHIVVTDYRLNTTHTQKTTNKQPKNKHK